MVVVEGHLVGVHAEAQLAHVLVELARLDDQRRLAAGVGDRDRLGQGDVVVTADDEVDAGDRGGQALVVSEPQVRQHDHDLSALRPQRLDRLRGDGTHVIADDHGGRPRRGIRGDGHAEDPHLHSADLADDRRADHPRERVLGRVRAREGQVGGQDREPGDVRQDGGEDVRAEVELVVAHGHGIDAQLGQEPKAPALRSSG